jgi:hypothetical protein
MPEEHSGEGTNHNATRGKYQQRNTREYNQEQPPPDYSLQLSQFLCKMPSLQAGNKKWGKR